MKLWDVDRSHRTTSEENFFLMLLCTQTKINWQDFAMHQCKNERTNGEIKMNEGEISLILFLNGRLTRHFFRTFKVCTV